MSKDWVGGANSVFTTLGASNHSKEEREINDFYATDPIAIDKLCNVFRIPDKIYEPACGDGSLSKRLKELGHDVYSTDLFDRGYGEKVGIDFLKIKKLPENLRDYSILTNPPYKYATEFVLKSLELVNEGSLVIMFLRLQFLEGKRRYQEIFRHFPPKYVFVSSERIPCAKGADFEKFRKSGGSAIAYAWFVWEKGFIGKTRLEWI